jgi:hypothetical protein
MAYHYAEYSRDEARRVDALAAKMSKKRSAKKVRKAAREIIDHGIEQERARGIQKARGGAVVNRGTALGSSYSAQRAYSEDDFRRDLMRSGIRLGSP